MMQKRVYFSDSRGFAFAVPVPDIPRIRTEDTRTGQISYEYNPPRQWSRISYTTYRKLVKNGRGRK